MFTVLKLKQSSTRCFTKNLPLTAPVTTSKRAFILTALSTAATAAYSFVSPSISLANSLENGTYKPQHLQTTNERELQDLETSKSNKPMFTRPEPNYPNHIPLYTFEKTMLFFGSSLGAFLHPERNEFIVALGESTAHPYFLNLLRDQMLSDPIGRQILKERPNITSTSLDLEYLSKLPQNTFGRTYVDWLHKEGVSPDTRVPVRFIDDEELAFIFQRYRQCHDFYHSITGLPIVREGEIAVKMFEFLNLKIPFAGLGAIFAPFNVKRRDERWRLFEVYYPWAWQCAVGCKPLINVYWEKIMERDVNEVRKELGVIVPPDMRQLRKVARMRRLKGLAN
ncbi:unnamed protein product [Ambrosiozyma monospora]|uniref:4-hydroxy-3-methoxy-5-polyprenylbenzoate decarboxylase n=1 Tax=Ambrosiozyma monospora TaxID=43982 RepID=A0A9W6YVS2_AMBMO|nr:unnamed protein product [Ambrosiozyma monospora]